VMKRVDDDDDDNDDDDDATVGEVMLLSELEPSWNRVSASIAVCRTRECLLVRLPKYYEVLEVVRRRNTT